MLEKFSAVGKVKEGDYYEDGSARDGRGSF